MNNFIPAITNLIGSFKRALTHVGVPYETYGYADDYTGPRYKDRYINEPLQTISPSASPIPQNNVQGVSAFQQAINQPSSAPVNINPAPSISPTSSPVLAAVSNSDPSLALEQVQKMISVYGGDKSLLSQYANNLMNATKMDFWKNNPELLALIPHLETNSGKYITRPNNLTNWGINYPGNNEAFKNMDVGQVLDLFLSGVGQRSDIYNKFRTGKTLSNQELMDFAKTYEPANGDYGPNLINGRKHIREVMGWPELPSE